MISFSISIFSLGLSGNRDLECIRSIIETNNRIEVTRSLEWGGGGVGGEENGELLFNGYRVSVWDDKKVLEMNCSDGYITL